jgi:hypothetical protein
MSDYLVIWSGRGAIPGMSSVGWERRGNLLLDEAPGNRGDWLSAGECDKAVKAPSWRQVSDAGPKAPRRSIAGVATHCGCGRALYASEQGKGIRRCKACRRARAAGRRLDAREAA